MTRKRHLIFALIGLLLLPVTACAASDPPDDPGGATQLGPPGAGLSRVIFLGDSVALGEALAVGAALGVAEVDFHSMASEGGGNVVGPFSQELWKTLPDRVATAKPSTVIYQVTTYDWGDEAEQYDAYERLLSTVTGVGAMLVFVTGPPIVPDEFYEPHMDDLERAPEVARRVADDSDGQAVVLDAGQVWGDTYERYRNDVADRSSDGIHTCPQGAARFADWLLEELAALYTDFTPPAPEEWANLGWAGDDHFRGC